jgi:hypothetical protein
LKFLPKICHKKADFSGLQIYLFSTLKPDKRSGFLSYFFHPCGLVNFLKNKGILPAVFPGHF